jgi:transcriptional regulator with XRE-family HTH domain
MSTTHYKRHQSVSFINELGHNVRAAMLHAGPSNDSGTSRLRAAALQRQIGIARTTLRALVSCKDDIGPNPDLRTLAKLAEVLDVPLAFLVMRPEDWEILATVAKDLDNYLTRSDRIKPHFPVPPGEPAQILRDLQTLPEAVDPGLMHDRAAIELVARRNDRRMRLSHILGSLMLRNCTELRHKLVLAALAAGLANELSYDRTEQSAI